jgi:hypothetical protein
MTGDPVISKNSQVLHLMLDITKLVSENRKFTAGVMLQSVSDWDSSVGNLILQL